jgi:hypothetical protein
MSEIIRTEKGTFAKGYKGGGRKALSPELRAARAMAYEVLINEIINVRQMTLTEAKGIVLDTEMSLGKRAIIKSYIDVDTKAIQYFESRAFGKCVETIDLGSGQTPEATEGGVRSILEKFGLIKEEDLIE